MYWRICVKLGFWSFLDWGALYICSENVGAGSTGRIYCPSLIERDNCLVGSFQKQLRINYIALTGVRVKGTSEHDGFQSGCFIHATASN